MDVRRRPVAKIERDVLPSRAARRFKHDVHTLGRLNSGRAKQDGHDVLRNVERLVDRHRSRLCNRRHGEPVVLVHRDTERHRVRGRGGRNPHVEVPQARRDRRHVGHANVGDEACDLIEGRRQHVRLRRRARGRVRGCSKLLYRRRGEARGRRLGCRALVEVVDDAATTRAAVRDDAGNPRRSVPLEHLGRRGSRRAHGLPLERHDRRGLRTSARARGDVARQLRDAYGAHAELCSGDGTVGYLVRRDRVISDLRLRDGRVVDVLRADRDAHGHTVER